MSPAGLVVNYYLVKLTAHLRFPHAVSKVEPVGLLHSPAHGKRAQKTKPWRSWCRRAFGRCAKIATARARRTGDWLSRGTLRNGFSDRPEAAIASNSPFALSLQTETLW